MNLSCGRSPQPRPPLRRASAHRTSIWTKRSCGAGDDEFAVIKSTLLNQMRSGTELQRIIEREFGPQKTPLYRPPAAKAEAAVTLPPRRKEYLIVDGYNMIFAWDGLREQAGYDLSGARERLLDLLSNYCGFHPCELIVVFDSYRVRGGTGSRSSHNNLRVVYTQEDESADLYIETLVGKIGKNYAVRVATSDALIQLSALRSGVLRVSAAELERELERTNGEIAAVLRRLREEARHAAGQESPLRALDPKSNPDKEEPI